MKNEIEHNQLENSEMKYFIKISYKLDKLDKNFILLPNLEANHKYM